MSALVRSGTLRRPLVQGTADCAIRVAVNLKRSETHAAKVHPQHSSGKRLTDARNDFDGLDGAHASDRSRDSAEYWKLSFPMGRLFRKDTTQARRSSGNDGCELGLHVVHRTLDQRLALGDCLIVHGKTLRE